MTTLKFWPDRLVPPEFALQTLELELGQLPVRHEAFKRNGNDLVGDYRGHDWNWAKVPSFGWYAQPSKPIEALGLQWVASGAKVWMNVGEHWPDEKENIWVLMEGEIAAMVASDFVLQTSPYSFISATMLLITEDGKLFGSHRGCWSLGALFLSDARLPGGEEFRWPDWAALITSRHPEKDWGQALGELFERQQVFWKSFVFYSFCVESLRDYVFEQLQKGSDEAVAHVLETLHLLKQMGYGPPDLNITVWDDLAIAFYDDHPPKWVLRLWDFMNPLELWIDMRTQEYMDYLRGKAAARDGREFN